jgi:PadR family transcriptional regulator PadR
MADSPSDLVQGTLDMLILKTLALEPMHGYGIAVRLEQMSKGVFRLNAGSLFVAFQRPAFYLIPPRFALCLSA